jgi:phosphatidylinositol alpha-1,6-mannosyltransferase
MSTGRAFEGVDSAIKPILLVTELYPPAIGGSAVLLSNIYTRIAATPLTVLADDRVGADEAQGAARIIRRRLRSSHWGFAHPRGLARHLRTAFTIWRIASQMSPRPVVHCGRILPEGVAARLARMGGGPRFVCWTHGEDLAFMSKSRELMATLQWVLRGAEAVIANSGNTKAVLSRMGFPDHRIVVVHPGVDCARFCPDVNGADILGRHGLKDSFVVLSVGRLQARKGHDVAIRAVAALAPVVPTLKYLIVGDGEERPSLERLVTELGVNDRVVFVGQVAEETLPQYYAASDVFLLANRVEQGDFEGFGIVFLEAAASGKGVVGGASGGVVEAVEDGVTGSLVDGASVAAVTAALAKVIRSPEMLRDYGARGRQRAVQGFSWEAAAAKVKSLHESCRRGPA